MSQPRRTQLEIAANSSPPSHGGKSHPLVDIKRQSIRESGAFGDRCKTFGTRILRRSVKQEQDTFTVYQSGKAVSWPPLRDDLFSVLAEFTSEYLIRAIKCYIRFYFPSHAFDVILLFQYGSNVTFPLGIFHSVFISSAPFFGSGSSEKQKQSWHAVATHLLAFVVFH